MRGDLMKERKEVVSLVDYRIAFDRVSLLPREKLSIVIYKNKKDYESQRRVRLPGWKFLHVQIIPLLFRAGHY